VPLAIAGPGLHPAFALEAREGAGLANVAATLAQLLGFEAYPGWEPSLLKHR
jgi:hypothetical protein